MSTHQHDPNKRPDSEFFKGMVAHLVESNKCRLLDGRRTTGTIEKVFFDSAIFRWRITKYEDAGKYWDMPFELIDRFQFERDSILLDEDSQRQYLERIKQFQKSLIIKADSSVTQKTETEIEKKKIEILNWMKTNSVFYTEGVKIHFDSKKGVESLAGDLKRYFDSEGLYEIEKKTAEQIVLNPNSGEWIKGMEICLAEMGLVSYEGLIPRTKDIFDGVGTKQNRYRYLITRFAFVRAMFELQNIHEVVLYRGMSTENAWVNRKKSLLSCTFNHEVADDFASFTRESRFKNSYIIKITLPISRLFFTFFETREFSRQYLESEALILYNEKLWI